MPLRLGASILALAIAAPVVATSLAWRRLDHARRKPNCNGKLAPKDRAQLEPLTMIHVPRTGGSTIEDCTWLEPRPGDKWGKHHPDISNQVEEFRLGADCRRTPQSTWVDCCFRQHVPPSLLSWHFDGRETFCVVRDPYERAISQLGFDIRFYSKYSANVTDLNRFITTELPRFKQLPYLSDCHFLPQAAYVRGWDGDARKVDREQRSCKHVLRYENLAKDFNGLMEEKGYPYRIDENKRNGHTNSPESCKSLRKEDLNAEARRLIEEVYRDDFELFGYPRLG